MQLENDGGMNFPQDVIFENGKYMGNENRQLCAWSRKGSTKGQARRQSKHEEGSNTCADQYTS